MARIPVPEIQERIGTARANQPYIPAQPFSSPELGQGVAAIGQGVSDLGAAMQKAQDEQDRAWASRTASDATVQWAQRAEELKATAQPNGAGYREGLMTEFDGFSSKTLAEAPKSIRPFLQEQMLGLRHRLNVGAGTWQIDQGYRYTVQQHNDSIDSAASAILTNPGGYDEARARILAALNVSILNPQEKARLIVRAQDTLATAKYSALLRDNPQAILDGTRGSNWSPDAIINNTIDRFEGTAYVAQDGNSGAPAKFGINQRANPDVDVAALTRDSAVQIYKDRYWKAVGADALPPEMAAVAFDTAVNMGVEPARDMVAKSGGDPRRLLQLRRDRYQRIAERDPSQRPYLQGWLNRVDALEKDLPANGAGDPAFRDLPLDKQISFLRGADSAVERQRTAYRGYLTGRVQDAAAMAQDGIADPNPVSVEDFARGYGAEDAVTQFARYEATQDLARDVAAVRGMPEGELASLMAARQPRAGAGYAEDDRRFSIFQQAVAGDIKARRDDPARYAMTTSPEASSAYAGMTAALQQGDMAAAASATQRYAEAVTTEQTRLGMRPNLLTKPEVARISGMFLDTSQGGRNAASLMSGLQDQWGKHFNTVYRQLATEGKLPASALVVPNMSDSGAAERAVRAATPEATKAYKDAVGTTVTRDIGESLRAQMAPFLATLVNQNGGESTYESVRSVAEALALSYAAGGATAEQAAKQAFTETAGHAYAFEGTFRVPRTEMPDQVIAGVRDLRRNADRIPAAAFPDLAGLTPENQREAMLDLLKNSAVFVTDGEERGLDLFVDQGAGLVPVMGMDGKQLNIPWATLRDVATASRGERFAEPVTTGGGAFIGIRSPGQRRAGDGEQP